MVRHVLRGAGVPRLLVVIATVGMVVACGSPPSDRAGTSQRRAGDVAAPPPGEQKTIVVGQGFEMQGLNRLGRNDAELGHVLNAGLVTRDTERYQMLPWMAEKIPTLDDGSWQVNPDGTMVTTWQVKPNIRWHDGVPFKTSDFAFGVAVFTDPKMQIESRGYMGMMDRLETPDDRTLVIHWKNRFSYATALFFTTLMPLPEHILGQLHRDGDYEALNNNAYWNAALVHLGPFKVAEFVPGSHVSMVAFDDYFLGRPKVDRVVWRIISDANALLTAVLTNDVDVTTRAALNLDTAITAEAQWVSRGEGIVRYGPTSWSWLNPSATNPIFGWDAPSQNRIRQALLHAVNRQEIVETLSHGKEEIVHIPLGRGRPAYPAAEAAAKKYPYDPRLAEQLLAESGWARGADGILTSSRGDRFAVELRNASGAEAVTLAPIAGYLRQAGIEVQELTLTDRQNGLPENRNRWPGLAIGSHNTQLEDFEDRFHTRNIPTEANGYVALNVSAWRNPQKDALIEAIFDELDAARQSQMIVELMRLFTEELPHLPLKYRTEVTSFRSNIKNVPIRLESGGENARTWNIHLWEKQ